MPENSGVLLPGMPRPEGCESYIFELISILGASAMCLGRGQAQSRMDANPSMQTSGRVEVSNMHRCFVVVSARERAGAGT